MSSTNGNHTVIADGVVFTDPYARLRAAIQDGPKGEGPIPALLPSEAKFIGDRLTEIEQLSRDWVKAQEDKSAILDTLLGAVQENLVLEQTVVDQRGTIADLDRELENTKHEFAQMVNNAIQSERTINALTRLTPAEFNNAADAFIGLLELTTIVGAKSEDPRAFAKQLDESGAPSPSQLRELSRRFREMAIAVERANDGVKAR